MNYLQKDYEVARRLKWAEGQKEYGPEFVGCPYEEFGQEMLDAGNYLEELERRGVVFPAIFYVWLKLMFDRARSEKAGEIANKGVAS